MADNTNPMVSSYPSAYHANAMQRLNAADQKKEFPVSADARLRMLFKLQSGQIPSYAELPERLTSVAKGTGPWNA